MRRIVEMSILLLAVSCEWQDAQLTANDPSTYVALINGDLWIASERVATNYSLCLDQNCTPAIDLRPTGTKDGRRFAKLSAFSPQHDHTYILRADGTAIMTFKTTDTAQLAPLDTALAAINQQTIERELHFLAADDFQGRLSATPDHERAGKWIEDHLTQIGFEKPPGRQSYRQTFRLGVGPTAGRDTFNVIGYLPGQDPQLKDQVVVVGAHLDHAGTLARGFTCSARGQGDSICNGADDNGSGSVALLNIAKSLAAIRTQLKRSVLVMWFSGEEEGLLGSNHYVNRDPIFPLAKTVYMINLDMVGYLKQNSGVLAALGGGTSRAGQSMMTAAGRRYGNSVNVRVSAQPGGGSDHAPFMAKGIPGVFFHTGVESNPNYHRTSDHPTAIDFAGLTVATKIAAETAVGMLIPKDATVAEEMEYAVRTPFVTDEELKQSCHHLVRNPFAQQLDFRDNNSGVLDP
jgi:acetylornithine deacetylase/succinyl-diaminopimelate desuccinylase-like protein